MFVRTSIAIATIKDVFYDYYVGFVADYKSSITEEKTSNLQVAYEKTGTMQLMHIAPVDNSDDGPFVQAKLLQLVNDMKKAYSPPM